MSPPVDLSTGGVPRISAGARSRWPAGRRTAAAGISRRALFLGLAAAPFAAEARETLRLPSELANRIEKLPGLVTLGNAKGDVTLYEFFDYNCPYCRNSARDILPLIKSDPGLRYVLVNYAVLGAPSIEAARVALAVRRLKPPAYLAFHLALFERRGQLGGARALEAAAAQGLAEKAILAEANQRRVTDAMIQAAKLGEALGIVATPSYVTGVEALLGFVPLEEKQAMVANMRKCERASC